MPDKALILVVDDSATSAMLLAAILKADGYEVAVAENGERALTAVALRAPDMILLDLHMAGLSGLDVCRELKSRPLTRDTPVIFISGATDTAERVQGLDAGAVDFISKPVQRAELRARVRTHLELRKLQVESDRHAKALEMSVREKEGLLKEAHHRVKNNLALIISLMRIEAGRSRNAETQAVLKQMQGRMASVVLLNEVLYKTASYTHVKLANYLRQIATHVFQAQNASTGAVRLGLDLQAIQVETRQAIPCGLIVNELLTNSLKHAFPKGESGEVRVRLSRTEADEIQLVVSDTGKGLPGDFTARQQNSLGLELVTDLVRQLGGSLDVTHPASFVVTFR